jgi:hypothetical protein
MTRWLALLAAASAIAFAANAAAQPRAEKGQAEKGQKAEKSQKAKSEKGQKPQKAPVPKDTPLHLYLAKGEPNACGEGCSEWIAAEGSFDGAAPARVQTFLKRHGARKLPVYFSSPGGSGNAAMEIGRQFRRLGITVGVGTTIPRGCASGGDQSEGCRAAKRSAQAVPAEWRPDSRCSSACVWALAGGKARHVPPAARLGIHSPKFSVTRRYSDGRVQQLSPKEFSTLHKNKAAAHLVDTRRYLREMGIEGALLDAALKIPHESIHYLSRNDIAAYGIDRRKFDETRWLIVTTRNDQMVLTKWLVEAIGEDRKDYRVSTIWLACAGPRRASIRFWRSVPDRASGKQAATFLLGKQKVVLLERSSAIKNDLFDTGGWVATSIDYVPFETLEAAGTMQAIEFAESDPWDSGKTARVSKISTEGMAEGVKQLRDKCAASGAGWPAGTQGATQVPFTPAQPGAGTPAIPGMPKDKLLLIERKKKKAE